MRNWIAVLFFTGVCAGALSCGQARGGSGQAEDRVPVKRFFSELPVFMHTEPSAADSSFLKRYAGLLPAYSAGVLGVPVSDSVSYREAFAPFFADSGMMAVYRDVLKEYNELADVETGLGAAYSRWREIWPDRPLPAVAAHVSGFNQSVIVTEDFVSVGLDKYMGPDYPAYEGLFYDYQREGMLRDRIKYDVMKVLLYTEFPMPSGQGTLLDYMIYEGKILYALGCLFPDAGEGSLIGYDAAQLQWCRDNEREIWKRMTSDRQLFSTDGLLRAKYILPAPYTAPLIRTSPGRVGQWTGWQIVKAYMKKHPKTSLGELLAAPIGGGQRFLRASGYHG